MTVTMTKHMMCNLNEPVGLFELDVRRYIEKADLKSSVSTHERYRLLTEHYTLDRSVANVCNRKCCRIFSTSV